MKKVKPKTSAERVAALRARNAEAGLSKLELWARPELHDRIRNYVVRISKEIR